MSKHVRVQASLTKQVVEWHWFVHPLWPWPSREQLEDEQLSTALQILSDEEVVIFSEAARSYRVAEVF